MANISICILRTGLAVSGQETLRYCLEGIKNVTTKVWDAVKPIFLRLAAFMSFPVDPKTQSLREGIEKAQIESLKTTLYIGLSGDDRGRKQEKLVSPSCKELEDDLMRSCHASEWGKAAALAEGVYALREKIENLSGEFVPGRVESIREDLVKLTGLPLYQRLENDDCKAINFIQYVAIKLLAANGNDALMQHGEECFGGIEDPTVTPGKLADLMHNYLKDPGFSKDTLCERIIYFVSHWEKALLSHQSGADPLKFDAGIGNPNFSAHDFDVGGKKVTFYYGPSIAGSTIFEHGVLPAYKKFGGGELRFDHQDTFVKGDLARINRAKEIAKANPTVLTYAVVGFGTKAEPTDFETSDQFFDTFIPFVKEKRTTGDNGYFIPNEVLNDEEIDEALRQAKDICCILTSNRDFGNLLVNERRKKRVRKMMKLVTDACLSRAVLKKSFSTEKKVDKSLDPDLTAFRTSGACKQDIDRGVVENIALHLFDRWATDTSPLRREEGYKIAGAVLGRAHLVEGRKIMEERFEVLEDFLHIIGYKQKKVTRIGQILNGSLVVRGKKIDQIPVDSPLEVR
jgi:hypothetical protein